MVPAEQDNPPRETSSRGSSGEENQLMGLCGGSDEKALLALLERDNLTPRHISRLLKNPYFPQAGVEIIAESVTWLGYREVKAAFARHPKAPRARALAQIPHLFWKELHDITMDFRVHAMVRRYAENALKERINGMALGELLTLAKMACREVIAELRKTKDVRVMEMLLINPRLVEGDIVQLSKNEKTPVQILSLVGRHPKWSKRRMVVMTLLRNRALPLQVGLSLVPQLNHHEAKALLRVPRLAPTLKTAIQKVLSQSPWPPNRP